MKSAPSSLAVNEPDAPACDANSYAQRASDAAVPLLDPGASQAANNIDTQDLRTALARFPTGVTVVTARSIHGEIAGVTVNSFCSVSLEPPLLLWCLSKVAPSQRVFMNATHFAIHVLAEDQAHLSRCFSRPAADKFAGLKLIEGLGGAPILGGVVALFECRFAQRYDAGDHVMITGEVERHRYTSLPPLLFHCGGYGNMEPKPAAANARRK
jgi:flavin reductase (DIM6/NTAB) family NADH-FMN oxidoreductase RutF